MIEPPIIRFENVSFRYSADEQLLEDASLALCAGEIVALLGDNGAGKSTLAKLADGMLLPDAGRVTVSGFDTADPASLPEARRRIGYVFQDPDDQIVATIVRDDVAFGPANLGLPREEVWTRVDEALAIVGMKAFARADANALSGGQKQRVAIAGALAMRPEALVLDEPTSMLDDGARAELLATLGKLRDDGLAILMITHDLDAARQADRMLVLDGGCLQEADNAQEAEALLLRARAQARARVREAHETRAAALQEESPLVLLEGASFSYEPNTRNAPTGPHALANATLAIERGELLAITGPNGSGKSTLIRLLNGLAVPTEGTVRVFGQDTATREGRNHAREHVGICFQYPEKQFFEPTVLGDVAAGPLNQGLHADEARKRAHDALHSVGFEPEAVASKNPFALSGGEQRRVAIAGFLAMKPDVLVLDEPCANLDIPAHASLLELIADLNARGTTVVLVSHDRGDVDALATRIVTLEEGRITRIDTGPSLLP